MREMRSYKRRTFKGAGMNTERVKEIAKMDQVLCEFEAGIDRFRLTSKKLEHNMPIDPSDAEIMKTATFNYWFGEINEF